MWEVGGGGVGIRKLPNLISIIREKGILAHFLEENLDAKQIYIELCAPRKNLDQNNNH